VKKGEKLRLCGRGKEGKRIQDLGKKKKRGAMYFYLRKRFVIGGRQKGGEKKNKRPTLLLEKIGRTALEGGIPLSASEEAYVSVWYLSRGGL